MGHRAQGLHVMPHAAVLSVETTRHEVRTAILFQEPAVGNSDPCGARHQKVGVLDAPIVSRGAELLVRPHAIKFQQPVLKATGSRQLPGACLSGCRIPGNHRFRPSTAGGGAHFNDAAQGRVGGIFGRDIPSHGTPGLIHQLTQVDWGGSAGRGAPGGVKYQCAHGAVTHIGQPVQGGDSGSGDAAIGHVFVDQRVAEVIWQRITQKGWQSLVGHLR